MGRFGSLTGVLVVGLVGVILAGCEGNSVKNSLKLKEFLQQPRSPVSASEYRVLPPDMIQITSLQVPDINNQTERLRPDGKINLPLLGELYVADRTPAEIEKLLVEKSREFYEKADATVHVVGYNSQKIYVFGQVSRPGPIPWTGADTVVDVLSQVTPTNLAWPEKIRLIRAKEPRRGGYIPGLHTEDAAKPKTGEETKTPPKGDAVKADAREAERLALEGPSEKADVMIVDLMAVMEKGDLSHNVLLKPDDVIYVPPNPLAAIGLAVQQLLLPIQPVTQVIQSPASAVGAVKYMP